MNAPYVLTLWGPLVAIFYMGSAMMIYGGIVPRIVAICTPVVLSGAIGFAVVFTDESAIALSDRSEFIPLLEVQAVCLMGIVGLFLLYLLGTFIYAKYKVAQAKKEGPWPLGVC